MDEITRTLGEWFAKAPHLPEGFRELLVKVAPWLTALALLFTIPALLAFFGFAGYAVTALGASGAFYGGNAMMSFVFALVGVVLQGLALPGLFARKTSGWTFSFYGVLWGIIQNLLSANILGGVVGAVIGFYILFEVKHLYH